MDSRREATEKLREFVKNGVNNSKDPHWIKMQQYKAEREKRRKRTKKKYGL